MKRIILTVLACVLGAAMLIGGSAFAAFMHNANTVNFNTWLTEYTRPVYYEGIDLEEYHRLQNEKRIFYPDFDGGKVFMPDLTPCYAEVDNACKEYAWKVRDKYNCNADLNFTVDHTGNLLTIKFTGTGYPENGEPEQLSRTFIFDIEGAGADKLPKLVNRAEFIGY